MTTEMENTKLTFKPAVRPGVKEHIRMFQSKSNGVDCRFGSGRCAEHNVKLCRRLVEKRVACVDKYGNTTWRKREATILACPMGKADSPQYKAATELDESGSCGGANKKPRIIMKNVNTQPQV